MSFDTLRFDNDRRMAKTAMLLFLVPSVWYIRTDLALYLGQWPMLTSRFAVRGVMIASAIVGWLFLHSTRSRDGYSRVVVGVAISLAASLLMLNVPRPAGSTLPLRVPLFQLALFYGALPNTLRLQIAPPLALSVGLAALRLLRLTAPGDGDVLGDVLILALMNVAGVLIVRRRIALEQDVARSLETERHARDLSERTLAELRTLRGIIPICSHCRKVRSELGDWEQLESYVRGHSGANFSHGICPDCLTEHYPESLQPAAERKRDRLGSEEA